MAGQRYGRAPRRTYLFGISNGGYLARWRLENRPRLYDGGVDWEGTLFRAAGPNLLTYLPTPLRRYPEYAATGDEAAHRAMLEAGFAKGSEFLWSVPLQLLLGPDPADLPRGARPRVRRGPRRGGAVLLQRYAEV